MIAAHRPGPDRLAAGLCPGGFVLHVYDLGGALVWSGTLAPTEAEVIAAAEAAARAAAHLPITVHVAYDGDDGHRLNPAEWRAAMVGT